ncbi:hypothetical protein M2351_006180 [Azospirillum canadense]|nr:hypothetical protein [Azospirillum canadense]
MTQPSRHQTVADGPKGHMNISRRSSLPSPFIATVTDANCLHRCFEIARRRPTEPHDTAHGGHRSKQKQVLCGHDVAVSEGGLLDERHIRDIGARRNEVQMRIGERQPRHLGVVRPQQNSDGCYQGDGKPEPGCPCCHLGAVWAAPMTAVITTASMAMVPRLTKPMQKTLSQHGSRPSSWRPNLDGTCSRYGPECAREPMRRGTAVPDIVYRARSVHRA